MTDAETVLEAEKEIRREGAKAAFLHAVIEATLVALAAVFVLSSSEVVSGTVGSVPVSIAVAAGLATAFGCVSFYLTYRRRTLETFEELNPNVKEALRTARDSARDGNESEMAQNLYKDVVEELQETSAEGFVSMKRVGASVVLILGVGMLLLHASFVGVGGDGNGLFGGGGSDGDEDSDDARAAKGATKEYDELQDPDKVLGEGGEVLQGTEDQTINLKTGSEGGEGGSGSATGSGGGIDDRSGSTNVDAQRAEFAPEEEIEDAELIKEYNLRIRDER